ncbi:hypothetical protein [Rheinheimera sp. 4Y26]|uniref:hypothetical protein n=1 Tax=Rheinheimera sp. 4Y26 TaxID=2977811 RepID=UPI0021B10728|nr:hypothetical protein [Rheinheimera sp. 4Y26]MCT6698579.1 hypothetical protein [Rheinheimera sp. 4Y26]
MQAKGFVLVVCLCFIVMVSAMAFSALTISQLSQRIGMAGQLQTQRYLSMKLKHLQQLQQLSTKPQAGADSISCPAQLAVWSEPQLQCQLLQLQSVASDPDDAEPWGTLLWRPDFTAVVAGGVS